MSKQKKRIVQHLGAYQRQQQEEKLEMADQIKRTKSGKFTSQAEQSSSSTDTMGRARSETGQELTAQEPSSRQQRAKERSTKNAVGATEQAQGDAATIATADTGEGVGKGAKKKQKRAITTKEAAALELAGSATNSIAAKVNEKSLAPKAGVDGNSDPAPTAIEDNEPLPDPVVPSNEDTKAPKEKKPRMTKSLTGFGERESMTDLCGTVDPEQFNNSLQILSIDTHTAAKIYTLKIDSNLTKNDADRIYEDCTMALTTTHQYSRSNKTCPAGKNIQSIEKAAAI
jgi:hypothetical protein